MCLPTAHFFWDPFVTKMQSSADVSDFIFVDLLQNFGGFDVPAVNTKFLVFCVLGSISQIAFTFLLMWLFSFRNFAAGIIFSKTETAQVALLGLFILGDPLSIGTIFAIAISLIGVLALSAVKTKIS